MGVRVTPSMVVGGLFLVLFLGPAALEATWTNPAGAVVAAAKGPASAWRDIGVWVGAPILVSSGVLAFALEWRTIGRAFKGLAGTDREGDRAAPRCPTHGSPSAPASRRWAS